MRLEALFMCGALLASLTPRPMPARPQEHRPAPEEATLSPYFWVQGGDAAVDRLPLKSTSVKADIAGVIAEVTVTQVYRNEGRKALEATYVFPGSTRAAVHGMTMTIGTRTIQAKIRTKEQARQDYEEARSQGRSASLLEQHRPNVFQMSVANILPGDEIRVELRYSELLVPKEGTYQFVYPTVVGPRYSNTPVSQATRDEQWVANPYTKQGEAPLSTFALELRLAAGMPIARMGCATHRTAIRYQGEQEATLSLDPRESHGGNRDFILDYRLAGQQVQTGLLLSRGKEENFFLLMVQPPKQVRAAQIPPREYVFIMDVSGSMHGFPLETSKALMRSLVAGLRVEDRINLMAFEGAAAVWSPGGSKPATAENLQQALAFVGSQSGGGGTEIMSALKKALALPRTPGMSRTFVIATDGYISVEAAVLDLVRKNLGDANMFAFGIGSSVNRFLIEGIAHAGMGEPFVITDPQQAPAAAERFRQYIASPVLTGIQVAFKGFQAYDVEPLAIPDVLSERPVICFGKWKGEPKGTVELTGTGTEGRYARSFRVEEAKLSESHAALRYLWARQRIQLLGDYAGLGQAEAQRQAITDLGLKYGLLTDYTSFVAVDSQIRNPGGRSESLSQPLPLPQGVSNYAVRGGGVGGTAMAVMGAPRLKKSADACVEMVACLAPAPLPAVRTEAAQELRPLPQRLTADRPMRNLPAIQAQIEARLKESALQALLSNAPQGCVLELRLDASGRVTHASFSAPFPAAAQALKHIQAWSFAGWKEAGTTVLKMVM